jgi:hypothetical protein
MNVKPQVSFSALTQFLLLCQTTATLEQASNHLIFFMPPLTWKPLETESVQNPIHTIWKKKFISGQSVLKDYLFLESFLELAQHYSSARQVIKIL